MTSMFCLLLLILCGLALQQYAVAADPEKTCLAPSGKSDFEDFFTIPNSGQLVRKVRHYFDAYEKHFARFRNQKVVTFVEMGVQSGGSIDLWKYYFGERLVYHGMDINPYCKALERRDQNIFIHIGSQDNTTFMQETIASIPNVDIVLDDASHQPLHMFLAFKAIFDKVQPNGVYMVEDAMTNYWTNSEFQGGPHSRSTFMHYAKHLVDELNAFNSERYKLASPTHFTSTCTSISFYDGMVAFEKGPHKAYEDVAAGKVQIPFHGEGRKPLNIGEDLLRKSGVKQE